MKKVTLYTTPTCPYCKMIKNYLSSKNIPYEDFDVSQNYEKLEEMIKVSGQMGVPVVVVDGEVIIGFNKEKIDLLLGI